jgi:hypothetical protein
MFEIRALVRSGEWMQLFVDHRHVLDDDRCCGGSMHMDEMDGRWVLASKRERGPDCLFA